MGSSGSQASLGTAGGLNMQCALQTALVYTLVKLQEKAPRGRRLRIHILIMYHIMYHIMHHIMLRTTVSRELNTYASIKSVLCCLFMFALFALHMFCRTQAPDGSSQPGGQYLEKGDGEV